MGNEAMQRQLRDLTDRADIMEVMGRYLHSWDEGVFDEEWARAFHTENVTAEMPIGTVHGRDALLAHVRRGMALFDRTVHLGSNAVIEVNGDQATARGAQLSTHVLADSSDSVFISAGHTATELVRTADGWRISATSLRVVWTQGTPPQLPDGLSPTAVDWRRFSTSAGSGAGSSVPGTGRTPVRGRIRVVDEPR